MHARRTWLVSIALVAGVLVPPAVGAERVTCRLVQDGAGDANASYIIGPNQPNAKAIDVISGDVATDSKHVGVAIRVEDVDQPNPHVSVSHGFLFSFARKGAEPLFMRAQRDEFGAWAFDWGYVDSTGSTLKGGTATGVVDVAKNEIRIWVTQAALGSRKIARRLHVVNPVIRTYDRAGVQQFQDFAPQDGTKSLKYVAGTPTCVPLGR